MLESYLYSILQPASKLSRAFWWRGRKRKKSKQLCLQNLKSASNSPGALHQLSCAISNHESEAEMSKNVRNNNEKHVKDQSANQHFTSNSRDVVASSPFFSHPTARLPQGACSQALYLRAFLSTFSLLNVILLVQF